MSEPKYRIGIMTMDVEGRDPEAFDKLTRRGAETFEDMLHEETNLGVETFAFDGPPLNAEAGGYQPLDFIQVGIAERAERQFSFLIIVTDVDLSSELMTYTLAMPSPLTNIAIVSTKRLDPGYWGQEPDSALASERLSTLMLHVLGALLNLSTVADPDNIMSPIAGVESLDRKTAFTADQRAAMRRALPREAFDRTSGLNRAAFAAKVVFGRLPAIGRAVVRANPLRLVGKLPTMLATALSVIVVLVFAAETWDYAGEVSPLKISIFALFSFLTAVFVLYRAFAFNAVLSRDGKLLESTVITAAATAVTLLSSVLLLFALLALLMWGVAEAAFPDVLKTTWSSVDPVTTLGDHVKLSVFLASIGVLAGSLGGAADSKNIIRNVLFAHREL